MWKQLLEALTQLITLTQETRQNRTDINSVKAAVQRLAYEIGRRRENEAHEREVITLRLENTLLKFERRLPPGKSDSE